MSEKTEHDGWNDEDDVDLGVIDELFDDDLVLDDAEPELDDEILGEPGSPNGGLLEMELGSDEDVEALDALEAGDEAIEEIGATVDAVVAFDDTVAARRLVRTVDDEDGEDFEDEPLLREKQSYEFVCQGCYLVRNRAQLIQREPVELCVDCC